jgi:hypothetical protein
MGNSSNHWDGNQGSKNCLSESLTKSLLRTGHRVNQARLPGSRDHFQSVLKSYFDYYHNCRCHLSLEQDSPEPRAIQPPEQGKVIAIPKAGGLHHHYTIKTA